MEHHSGLTLDAVIAGLDHPAVGQLTGSVRLEVAQNVLTGLRGIGLDPDTLILDRDASRAEKLRVMERNVTLESELVDARRREADLEAQLAIAQSRADTHAKATAVLSEIIMPTSPQRPDETLMHQVVQDAAAADAAAAG